MIKDSKTRIVVDEEREIVARLNAMAQAEGCDRADILRRAIRHFLLSTASSSEQSPQSNAIPCQSSN